MQPPAPPSHRLTDRPSDACSVDTAQHHSARHHHQPAPTSCRPPGPSPHGMLRIIMSCRHPSLPSSASGWPGSNCNKGEGFLAPACSDPARQFHGGAVQLSVSLDTHTHTHRRRAFFRLCRKHARPSRGGPVVGARVRCCLVVRRPGWPGRHPRSGGCLLMWPYVHMSIPCDECGGVPDSIVRCIVAACHRAISLSRHRHGSYGRMPTAWGLS